MDVPGKESPRQPMSRARYDAVVVGAGPYGLSTAAHLHGLGLKVAVFGKTLELWREHMPRGMLLRSQWFATNLSDPRRRYTFGKFLQESGRPHAYPFPRETFLEYASWFQRHAVPDVDETYVRSIARQDTGFLVTLTDGRCIESHAVVMAIGVAPYAHCPEEFRRLPSNRVTHSSELREPADFRNQRVVVIGGGQSAVECAALLRESGAAVDLVARHPIVWLEPDRTGRRGIIERILAPTTGIGPGWRNWVFQHIPFLFYHLPRPTRERTLAVYSGAWASDWLRPRIAGRVTLHEGVTVDSCDGQGSEVVVTLSDGVRISADHIILATGYRVDLDKLGMIATGLRAMIATDRGSPVLTRSFESSAPGLYFVGAAAIRSFGPMFRFVLGCRATAPRVSGAIARRARTPAKHDRVPHATAERRELRLPGAGEESSSHYPSDDGSDT